MAPEVLGNRYEVGRPIGRGATTRVLEAWDRQEQRHVALRVLIERLAGDEAFLGRLEREARTAASLSHPNIAAVHTVGWDSRTRFVVTELVDGPSLGDMLADRGPLPPVGAARVAANVCAALAAAHRCGVAHGHLTSANVLLAIDGRVKVTDFRLAQAARLAAAASDPAVDLQGVGRCLAAMLTGREPAADTLIRLVPEVPAELATIVLRAMGDLDSAYGSAAELGHDLDQFLASVQHGAASTVQPDLAPGHDRSRMVAVASSPAGQLAPLRAAEPPAHRVASAVASSLAGQRRRLILTAGLDREPGHHDQPVDHQPGTGHDPIPVHHPHRHGVTTPHRSADHDQRTGGRSRPTHRPRRGRAAPPARGRRARPSTARYPDGPDAGQRLRAGPAGGRAAALGRPGPARRVRCDRADRLSQADRLKDQGRRYPRTRRGAPPPVESQITRAGAAGCWRWRWRQPR
jgi:tRNA A-37 threonylcarbamoyl transferase component Bud32